MGGLGGGSGAVLSLDSHELGVGAGVAHVLHDLRHGEFHAVLSA